MKIFEPPACCTGRLKNFGRRPERVACAFLVALLVLIQYLESVIKDTGIFQVDDAAVGARL